MPTTQKLTLAKRLDAVVNLVSSDQLAMDLLSQILQDAEALFVLTCQAARAMVCHGGVIVRVDTEQQDQLLLELATFETYLELNFPPAPDGGLTGFSSSLIPLAAEMPNEPVAETEKVMAWAGQLCAEIFANRKR